MVIMLYIPKQQNDIANILKWLRKSNTIDDTQKVVYKRDLITAQK